MIDSWQDAIDPHDANVEKLKYTYDKEREFIPNSNNPFEQN